MLNNTDNLGQPINLFLITESTNVIETVGNAISALTKFDTLTLSCLNHGMANLIILAEILKLKVEGINI